MRIFRLLPILACMVALAACQDQTADQAPETANPTTVQQTDAPESSLTPAARKEAARNARLAMERTGANRLIKIVAGAQRSEKDRARDRYRHPVETLSFFGIKPDATVLEITPGGGWYTDIVAPFLRDGGRYIGAIWDESLPDQPAYYANLNKALTEKLDGNRETYGKAELRRFNASAPNFGEPGSVDLVLTFRNVHNWVPAGTAGAYFKAFHDVLKPGGVLGVVDHRAKGEEATDGSAGYLTEKQVIELAESAGFTLAERSEINANPKDTADHPRGVWTLPPTLALGDEDREKYAAIGESDRMTLKFVKPAQP